jgi:hypothetical protein
MTSQATRPAAELSKPLAGGVFLLLWAVAIVAWSLAHLIADAGARGFVIDVGIVLASVGFSALFLGTVRGLRSAAIIGLIGIVLFLVGDLLQIKVLVFELRILGPFLALLTPIFKVSNGIRIFN